MHRRQHLPDSLKRLAASQAGVVTSRQLAESGLTRDVISRMSRDWAPAATGLHLLEPPTFEAAAWAGVLRGGSEAVVGEHAAGYLNDVIRDAPSDITIWVPTRHAPFTLNGWSVTYRRGCRPGILSLPRTPVVPTLLDIANGSDENDTVSAVVRALVRGRTTPARILEGVDDVLALRHREVIQELCSQAGQGIESALEWRFQTEVLLPHGLPIPERQVQQVAGRVDSLYRRHRLVIELDGLRDHADASRDMRRDNHNTVHHDCPTLRFGWDGVHREKCLAARQIATLLWRGGWQEPMLRCPECLE